MANIELCKMMCMVGLSNRLAVFKVARCCLQWVMVLTDLLCMAEVAICELLCKEGVALYGGRR